MRRVIRIWDGCKVLAVVEVDQAGGATFSGASGGAESGTPVNLEIDPFVGLLVEKETSPTPVPWREVEIP